MYGVFSQPFSGYRQNLLPRYSSKATPSQKSLYWQHKVCYFSASAIIHRTLINTRRIRWRT